MKQAPLPPFTIALNGVTMKVTPLAIKGFIAFRVIFSSARQPLVIAKAVSAEDNEFWTSVPEGRQQEAEGVGNLIDNHLKTHTN